MSSKPEAGLMKILKLPRMLASDIRPMERCCNHHVLAHDTFGCLITNCACRTSASEFIPYTPTRRPGAAAPAAVISILSRAQS